MTLENHKIDTQTKLFLKDLTYYLQTEKLVYIIYPIFYVEH